MEQYIIKGGKPLVGEVTIGGAKNAALGVLAAAIMTDEPVKLHNLPDISDVDILLKAIEALGAVVERPNVHEARIMGGSITTCIADYDDLRKIRAGYYLCGALLGKYKRAEVPLPGGCNIGSRPIDQHIKGFEALGAKVVIQHGMIIAEAEALTGAHIYFDCTSVGATINVMLAACMAEGQTVLENAAKEPHVVEAANF
ncbi:MAG: UDP-N-acetylglucosamine 1-carboxyvinyltransferase, partial [Lachnospiraceae bacterium]|nr:UDP-N-acetylglucosamine 1-carboxyvinyltransferase [Lachnospiraceae bacterium]